VALEESGGIQPPPIPNPSGASPLYTQQDYAITEFSNDTIRFNFLNQKTKL